MGVFTPAGETRVAVLVDCDNVSTVPIDYVLRFAAESMCSTSASIRSGTRGALLNTVQRVVPTYSSAVDRVNTNMGLRYGDRRVPA